MSKPVSDLFEAPNPERLEVHEHCIISGPRANRGQQVEPGSPPLCSACSGTAADLSETLKRADTLLGKFSFSVDPRHTVAALRSMARAAMRRSSARMRADASNPDRAWGNR